MRTKANLAIIGIISIVLLVIDVLYAMQFILHYSEQQVPEGGSLMAISAVNIIWGVYLLVTVISNLNFSNTHIATPEERSKYKIDEFCPGCGKKMHVSKPIPDSFDSVTGKPLTAVIKIFCESRLKGVEKSSCVTAFPEEDWIE